MPQTLTPRVEQYRADLAEAAEGLPLPNSFRVWKPVKTKYPAYHLFRDCREQRSRSPQGYVGRMERYARQLCRVCLTTLESVSDQDGNADRLRNLVSLARVETALERLELAERRLDTCGPTQFLADMRFVVEMCRTAQRYRVGALVDVADLVTARARELHAEVEATVESPGLRLNRWCGSLTAYGRTQTSNEQYWGSGSSYDTKRLENGTPDEDGFGGRPGNRGHLNLVFDTWTRAQLDGADDPTARTTALEKAWASLESAPREFRQIPEVGRLDPREYPGPREWARAEWKLACGIALEALLTKWERDRDAVLALTGDRTVVLAVANVPDSPNHEITKVLTLAGARFEGSKRLALVTLPEVVARWVELQVPRTPKRTSLRVERCGEGMGDDQLEIAVGLYEPGGEGPLAELSGAVETARMMG